MTWKDILKATDGLDEHNVNELLVHPIGRLGFKLQQTNESYFQGDNPETGEPVWNTGQMSLNFRGPTGIEYVVKRLVMMVKDYQYVVFKGMNIDDKLFDYNAVLDYFANEAEDLT
jgi:hypothetical protein